MSGASNYQGAEAGQNSPDVVQDTDETQRLGTGQSQNDEWKEKYKEMNQAMLLEKLVQATKYKDKKRLEKCVKAYQESGLSTTDSDEYEDAQKLLDILQTKEALIEATAKKDENDIQLLLSSIDENEKEVRKKFKEKKRKWRIEDGYKHHLMYEMTEARKVMRVVASGRNKKRQSVPQSLKMDRNTMSEVKRYGKPPRVLHTVMQASLLLLGEDEDTTQDWGTCAKMANPDGRQGMNKRIQTLDTDELHPEICCRAKQILDGLEYRKLLVASAGGAAFYVWAMGTLDEFMRTHSLDGVEPANREKQKILLGKVDPDATPEQPMFTPKLNKNKAQAKVNSGEKFQRNLRAPHSAGKAEDALVEPRY